MCQIKNTTECDWLEVMWSTNMITTPTYGYKQFKFRALWSYNNSCDNTMYKLKAWEQSYLNSSNVIFID